jgi:salicylate hydroxylase
MAWHLRNIWNYERTRAVGVRTRSFIHRARLLEELVALVPAGIMTFRKHFDSAEEQAGGTIIVRFTDGTTTHASALIGCDGIESKVRDLVCPPEVQTDYARECAYRTVVLKAEAVAALGADLALNGHIYCGYGAYIITYPIEHGELINMVAIPYDLENETWKQDDWIVSFTLEEVIQRFAGWYSSLIDLITKYHLPSKWALFVLQHGSAYYKGKMCLVGDSAHATVPHLGAGAGMAMKYAFILSSLIVEAGSVGCIEDAFRAYDAVRRPRTQGCIKRSLEAALGYDCLLEGVGDDVSKLKKVLEESFKWLWHEDLEDQLKTGKRMLGRKARQRARLVDSAFLHFA